MARVNGKFVKRAPAADPAVAANQRILEDRQARLDQAANEKALANDLGLNLKKERAPAATAAEFLSEEWDRKTFGDAIPTYTRVVYGPDNLLITCPTMKAAIERLGLEEYANTTYETFLLKRENAVQDPVLRKGLRSALTQFTVEQVASSLRERILKIPHRTMEVEADRSDAMIFSKPMEDMVLKYGTPGMRAKFLSDRCCGILGMRGYVVVKDENGDPVKVGTLIMGEIPIHMADARQQHFADQSNDDVREQAEAYEDAAARAIHEERKSGYASVLAHGERVTATHTEEEGYSGLSRETGFTVERQR